MMGVVFLWAIIGTYVLFGVVLVANTIRNLMRSGSTGLSIVTDVKGSAPARNSRDGPNRWMPKNVS